MQGARYASSAGLLARYHTRTRRPRSFMNTVDCQQALSALWFSLLQKSSIQRLRTNILLTLAFVVSAASSGATLRIGIIGCDTSHVVAFTENLNNDAAPGHITGGRIVAAVKGGSPDVAQSSSRVEGFSKTLREKYDVKFYETIEEMCSNVDAVLLESVDGRPHLEQVKPVLKARKPVFIDKPMAGSLHDVIEIFRLANK